MHGTFALFYISLLHVTDWLPTLYSAAGGRDLSRLGPIDGLDQWGSLANQRPSAREEMLYNIFPSITGTPFIKYAIL